jgi:hypothetical protein
LEPLHARSLRRVLSVLYFVKCGLILCTYALKSKLSTVKFEGNTVYNLSTQLSLWSIWPFVDEFVRVF